MLVLGVDPSSTCTGWGLISLERRKPLFVACGCIRPRAGMAFDRRLVLLYDDLTEVIAEYRPDEAAIESTFFGKDARAAGKLGQARGALVVALAKSGLPVSDYAPAEVKKAVVGTGQATKQQVQAMMARMLDMKELPRPLDASDALGIAMCHLHRVRLRPAVAPRARRPEVEALLKRAKRR